MSKRAEVINLDPELNPKLREILDILLLAGYFRIRIPSISPLDKVSIFYDDDLRRFWADWVGVSHNPTST